MPETVTLPLVLGYEVIRSYRRLSYTPWTALAEFVDNSTESYLLNQRELEQAYAAESSSLRVRIEYDRQEGTLEIRDNAMGMSLDELQRALHIGATPPQTTGRSRFGMGLKTAACWFGNRWSIRTTKLGDPHEIYVVVDVESVAKGEKDLRVTLQEGRSQDHYTIIRIEQLNKPIEPRTRGKIKNYLASMYRRDIASKDIDLRCFGDRLTWSGEDFQLRTNEHGRPIRHAFDLSINGRQVKGWAGILKRASRARAGFTILHFGRVIRGWPDAWRPQPIFGQVQGSNDLVNQRLVGEVELDGFEVSHTKDDILWFGSEEDDVGEALKYELANLIQLAKLPLREAGRFVAASTSADLRFVTSSVQAELVAPELKEVLVGHPNGRRGRYDRASTELIESAAGQAPDFTASIGDLSVSGYLCAARAPSAPYAVSRLDDSRLIIVVNTNHSYVQELDRIGLLDHLRHTVFEALASWRAQSLLQSSEATDADFIKDRLFRVPALVRARSAKKAR